MSKNQKILVLTASNKIPGDLVAFAPSNKEGGKAMAVIIHKEHDNFERCKAGELWQVEIHRMLGKNYAIGYPIVSIKPEYILDIIGDGKYAMKVTAGDEILVELPLNNFKPLNQFAKDSIAKQLYRMKLALYAPRIISEFEIVLRELGANIIRANDLVVEAMYLLKRSLDDTANVERIEYLSELRIENELYARINIFDMPTVIQLCEGVKTDFQLLAYARGAFVVKKQESVVNIS